MLEERNTQSFKIKIPYFKGNAIILRKMFELKRS